MTRTITLSYLVAFSLGVISFVLLMTFLGWDLIAFTNPTLLFIPALCSGIVMKVLGGLGIAINYAVFCQLVFRTFSGSMKGRKGRVRTFKVILLVVAFVLCGYALYRIIGAFFLSQPQTLFDLILNIYGAVSLMVWIYILPAIRGSYGEGDKSVLDRIRAKIGNARFSLWKGYRYRIRRDYGTVQAAEYERLQGSLDDVRGQLSGLLLLPLALILLLFPPLIGVVLVLWVRLFSLKKRPLMKGERLILGIVSASILMMSLFINLFMSMPSMTSYLDLTYGFAILAGVFLLAYLVLKS